MFTLLINLSILANIGMLAYDGYPGNMFVSQ